MSPSARTVPCVGMKVSLPRETLTIWTSPSAVSSRTVDPARSAGTSARTMRTSPAPTSYTPSSCWKVSSSQTREMPQALGEMVWISSLR